MRRVMIIGGPGAGKSWLGQRLREKLSLPLTRVDDHVWRPDGSVRPAAEIDAALTDIAMSDEWIIEGGNTRTYPIRAARAEALIWLRPPRLLRLFRVLRRRPSMALLTWTWNYDRVFGPADCAAVQSAGAGAAVFPLRSRREVDDFLTQLVR